MLMASLRDIEEIAIASENHVMVGIPCCSCYRGCFSSSAGMQVGVLVSFSWILKLVVAGDEKTDKTRMIHRCATNTFVTDHKLTIGAAFSIKDITFEDGRNLKIQVWDFATGGRFRWLLSDYCIGASGALVCFDVTDYETFEHVPGWIDIIRKQAPTIPIILVGTGCEKPNHEVDYPVARQYAIDAGCSGAVYCSCEDVESMQSIFMDIGTLMTSYFDEYQACR